MQPHPHPCHSPATRLIPRAEATPSSGKYEQRKVSLPKKTRGHNIQWWLTKHYNHWLFSPLKASGLWMPHIFQKAVLTDSVADNRDSQFWERGQKILRWIISVLSGFLHFTFLLWFLSSHFNHLSKVLVVSQEASENPNSTQRNLSMAKINTLNFFYLLNDKLYVENTFWCLIFIHIYF